MPWRFAAFRRRARSTRTRLRILLLAAKNLARSGKFVCRSRAKRIKTSLTSSVGRIPAFDSWRRRRTASVRRSSYTTGISRFSAPGSRRRHWTSNFVISDGATTIQISVKKLEPVCKGFTPELCRTPNFRRTHSALWRKRCSAHLREALCCDSGPGYGLHPAGKRSLDAGALNRRAASPGYAGADPDAPKAVIISQCWRTECNPPGS